MSELAPIAPTPVIPNLKIIGQKQNQDKQKKQAKDGSTSAAPIQAGDPASPHIDEIV